MSFRITGLPLEPFQPLFGLDEAALAARGVIRMTVDAKPGSPCRVSLADAEGKAHVIPKKDIEERFFSPVSTMPNGLSDGMTLQDFADVFAPHE